MKTQCIKSYKVTYCQTEVIDITPELNSMVSSGWKIVSITPIAVRGYHASPTDTVLVVFEKDCVVKSAGKSC